jgi:adenylosuccinate synthase
MTAIAVVDLGFGDAGKGHIVDFLARSPGSARGTLVVRFNGGAQAGHNVVTPDGRHHTFAQIGSGTFVPGAHTHLASRVVVHPTGLLLEAERLKAAGVSDTLDRVTVSPECPVVTPFHQAACRVREIARGGRRHGSCGVGVGEVMSDAVRAEPVRTRDMADPLSLRRLLARVQERVLESVREAREAAEREPHGAQELGVLDDAGVCERWIEATRAFVAKVRVCPDDTVAEALGRGEQVIFEGAQGVLLDEDWGFHPYTTWSHCTFVNALQLLAEVCPGEALFRLGVVRVYAHRHGPGPLPTETPELGALLDEPHNVNGPWQGPFRVGWPDMVLARYARAAAGPIDGLALTHLDALDRTADWKMAPSYGFRPGSGEAGDLPSDEGRLREWPLDPPFDFARRAESTRRLMRMSPELVAARAGDIEEALSAAYQARVVLRSTGPTGSDVAGGL